MKVLLRHSSENTFICKAPSNHWLVLESASSPGGPTSATSPFEALVMAAGGCVSLDSIAIIRKMRKDFTRFDMEVSVERAESHPKRILAIHFHATFAGELTGDDIVKALDLSLTKYCSVTLSLDRSVEIKASYTCNGTPGPEWIVPRNLETYS